MKALFVQHALGQEMIGLMYLSRVLKDAGHETEILFLPTTDDVLKTVRRYGPDMLCYGTTTGLHRRYMAVNRYIREHYDAFSVFGGIYPTFAPGIIEDPAIDAICIGEGEPALVELAGRLERRESVADVLNFHIKEDGEVHYNAVRPLVQDLDSLGFPDREFIYRNPLYGNNGYKVFMTSRGCVARCHYCFHSGYGGMYDEMEGAYLRRRSVEHMIAEIEEVRDHWPLEFVHFTDDMFNFDAKWQEEFLQQYRQRIGLPFSAIFMIDWISPELLASYRDAGCVNVRIAFETASDDLKHDLNRFKDSPSNNQMDAAKMVADAGIRLTTLNMVGVPGGSVENEINTLKMNLIARPKQVLVNFIHPYPGDSMDLVLEQHGLTRKPYDEYEPSATRSLPIDVPHRNQVENIHHLFPLVVRFPKLINALPKLSGLRGGWVQKFYLGLFGFCMDWQYAELLHCSKGTVRRRIAIPTELAKRLVHRFRTIFKSVIFSMRNPIRV